MDRESQKAYLHDLDKYKICSKHFFLSGAYPITFLGFLVLKYGGRSRERAGGSDVPSTLPMVNMLQKIDIFEELSVRFLGRGRAAALFGR